MSDDKEAGKRVLGYVASIGVVLLGEDDPSVVMATLSSVVGLALAHFGIPVAAFTEALNENQESARRAMDGALHVLAKRGKS